MHHLDEPAVAVEPASSAGPWYRELNGYHWFVLAVAALGWLFDCLDQQLFVLARPAAMKELLPPNDDPAAFETSVKVYGNYATSVFLIGWASGGLIFGMLGDRIGRAKTMLVTILVYSIFTGLSALSVGFWDFALYRFLTGLGVGGEFAVGVALVAEAMPGRARPYALALLQALSAIGNVTAALINLGLGVAQEEGFVKSPWRIMFLIGAVPALLALLIRRRLREPERWRQARAEQGAVVQLGSYSELLGDARWRRHAIGGLILASSGVIGLWAIGFFSPDLIRYVSRSKVAGEVYDARIEEARRAGDDGLAATLETLRSAELNRSVVKFTAAQSEVKADVEKVISGRLARWASYTSMMINAGAFLGMFGFGAVAQRIGRKPTFAIAFFSAAASTAAVFWFLDEFTEIFWMVPLMGFCQLSLFAGYAIYFPELFPTRLRSTGTSFCYNVGRVIAATGPLVQASLIAAFAGYGGESMRYAGVTMCSIFFLGLLVLPFLPETKGRPLPE